MPTRASELLSRAIRQASIAVFAGALLLAGPGAASAQTCDAAKPATGKEARSALARLVRDRCLAEIPKVCQTEICKQYDSTWLASTEIDKSSVKPALERLIDDAAGIERLPDESRRVANRMAVYLAELIDADFDPLKPASAMFRADQTLQTFQGNPAYAIDWSQTFTRECTTAERCSAAFGDAVALLEDIVLFRRVIAKAQAGDTMALAAYVRTLDARWQHYLLSGRAQYPWELAVNSALRKTGRGLIEPPTYQFIFLHPSAGYEVSRTGDSYLTESLVLELAGVYRFRWSEAKGEPRQLSGFGASLLMAARSDPGDTTRLGYGAMAYLPRGWAIGYVWRPHDSGDEHAVLVNADVAKLFMKGESLQQRARRLASR